MAPSRSFWLTLVCAVCLVVFVVRIEGSPGGEATNKNSTTNATKGASVSGNDSEECDLDPEPEAEAEPSANKNWEKKTNGTNTKSAERQGKDLKPLDGKDTDKYNTTGHDGKAEPEPESEPTKNDATAKNASLNNEVNKPGQSGHDQKDNPTAGKSTASNTTTTTPSPSAGGSKSIMSITTLALLSLPVFL